MGERNRFVIFEADEISGRYAIEHSWTENGKRKIYRYTYGIRFSTVEGAKRWILDRDITNPSCDIIIAKD